jgi:hypothetical protein
MAINIENFKILRDAVKANQRFSMEQFTHDCGTAACILGTAGALLDIKPEHISESNEEIAEWLGIDGGDMFHIAYGDWTETSLDDITQEQALEYLNKVIDFGYVDVGKAKFSMQELLDHARSPAAVYDPIPNPWKWDTEAEKWTALDDEGGLWESEDDEITAVQVGWL